MSTALVPRAPAPWYRRWWDRVLALVSEVEAPMIGADYAQEHGADPVYDPDSSASAPLVFPWPYACTRVRASAIARLDLRVYTWEQAGDDRERAYLDDHWLIGLAERPNSYTPGNVFVQELQADLDNEGNAYVVIVGIDPGSSPQAIQRAIDSGRVSLHRIPPKRMRVIPATWGIQGYEQDDGQGGKINLAPELVLNMRRLSTRDGVRERFYGVGAVRPLSNSLEVEQSQTKRDKSNAAKGRPSVVLSPASNDVRWTKDQIADIRDSWSRMTKEDGGAVVSPGHTKVEALSFSPSEYASANTRDMNRAAILAAYRVPPVMVGLETANYATAREQKAVFWESIQDDASIHAWMWTELARRAGERDVYAELDFGGVQELVAWKAEAMTRANTLWMMGADLDTALRTQGLHEEAEILEQKRREREEARKPAADDGDRTLRVLEWWQAPTREAAPPLDDEDAREDRWRAIDKQLLAIGERELLLATRKFLEDQGQRIADKLGEEDRAAGGALMRDGAATIVATIFDTAAERAGLSDAVRRELWAIVERAWKQGQIDIGEDGVVYDQSRIDELVDRVLGELVVNVSDETKAAVNRIITKGLAEGQSIAEMQMNLMQDQAFSAARALRIARTETTRSTGAGTVRAYKEAADQLASDGIIVKKQWLSSRDSAVRDAHRDLDGQTVGADEDFVVPPGSEYTGDHGSGPGNFSEAGMVVNCRCAVVPVIERTG